MREDVHGEDGKRRSWRLLRAPSELHEEGHAYFAFALYIVLAIGALVVAIAMARRGDLNVMAGLGIGLCTLALLVRASDQRGCIPLRLRGKVSLTLIVAYLLAETALAVGLLLR